MIPRLVLGERLCFVRLEFATLLGALEHRAGLVERLIVWRSESNSKGTRLRTSFYIYDNYCSSTSYEARRVHAFQSHESDEFSWY